MITRCINQTSADPYFNLASEEYFLKNSEDDLFMLWQSDPSVIVGKHQNALAEINHDFVREKQVLVARRLSGGGTVFHDRGNVNFTFIRKVADISEINFRIFTVPVIKALKKLGIEAYTSGRNDLLIDGKKISGNAEHLNNNRVLHHGTLLFDCHLDALSGALNADLSKFEGKAVPSNRSEVTNISYYLSKPLSVEEFKDSLFTEICQMYSEYHAYSLTSVDVAAIEKLRAEKYQTWEWIFGRSPRYRFSNRIETANDSILVKLLVEKGRVAEASFSGGIGETGSKMAKALVGCRHDFEDIKSALFCFGEEIQQTGKSLDEFVKSLF
jgi:lipoate---protein ligase